jgi:hypothetical protein
MTELAIQIGFPIDFFDFGFAHAAIHLDRLFRLNEPPKLKRLHAPEFGRAYPALPDRRFVERFDRFEAVAGGFPKGGAPFVLAATALGGTIITSSVLIASMTCFCTLPPLNMPS